MAYCLAASSSLAEHGVSSTRSPRLLSPSTSTASSRPHSNKSSHISSSSVESSTLPHDIFTITDQVLASQYTFEKEIGFGNWGSIWRLSTNNVRRSTLATKLVHRDKSSNTTAARIKSLWGEFKILRRFKDDSHPNVLRVSSFIITPSYALLTMAFHPACLPVKLGETSLKSRKYIRGLLSGVDFLHKRGVSHNDIKPANVVLDVDDEPVLIDFGFAVAYNHDCQANTGKKPFWSTLTWGTPEYLSPQRAKGEGHDERLSDIWSLGVTFYEIVVGRTPFEAHDQEEFLTKPSLEIYYQRTLKAEFLGPHTLSTDLRRLLVSMLRPNPTERLQSCSIALAHSYFRRISPDLSLHRRSFEPRALSSRLVHPPSDASIGYLSRRVQQVDLQSSFKENLNIPTTPPSSSRRPHLEILKGTPRSVNKPIAQLSPRTPRSASSKATATPTRPNCGVLTPKTTNTPTTPRQKRVPVPPLDQKVKNHRLTLTPSKQTNAKPYRNTLHSGALYDILHKQRKDDWHFQSNKENQTHA
ncbi:hypothetical protein O181_058584 [Austropuccinia psidii MF-1]|uniref:Protein kinase domain-containing protein n=1 Tax=Austropuccinia psidii MF-1 TaxID=1389203 RepID=A0A9Q3ECQ4_9BASI|nr:hypothetical protein [Austropuccinia psidii MF-1]